MVTFLVAKRTLAVGVTVDLLLFAADYEVYQPCYNMSYSRYDQCRPFSYAGTCFMHILQHCFTQLSLFGVINVKKNLAVYNAF